MFNEPASSYDEDDRLSRRSRAGVLLAMDDAERTQETFYSEIREAVESVLTIENETFALEEDTFKQRRNLFLMSADSRLLMTFNGRLRLDAEVAYDQLDALFAEHDLLPIFREQQPSIDPETGQMTAPHLVYVVQGRVQPQNGGVGLSIVLFLLTILSVMLVGWLQAVNTIAADDIAQAQAIFENPLPNLWRGLPYTVGLLLILGAHELGHYFAARYHKTAASLPYFLPFPISFFGTLGAAIRLREPMRNRKILLDIGAAGPLVGLAFAIPILLIGLATSEVARMNGGVMEGNSILYAVSKFIVFGEFLPNGSRDVIVNQLAWAGWTGLLVTGLNLIPVGQLDGGHILYALLGRTAKLLYYPIIGALILLTIFVSDQLILFLFLLLLFGNMHAVPLNDITQLDMRRRGIAVLSLVVFALVFVPSPLQIIEPTEGVPIDGGIVWLPVGMILLWQRVRHGGWRWFGR